MTSTVVFQVFNSHKVAYSYQLSSQAQTLVGDPNPFMSPYLTLDASKGEYAFNSGYVPSTNSAGQSAHPKYGATFSQTPQDGVTVSDPSTRTSITVKPQFALAPPQKDQNRLIYPFMYQNAVQVYSMRAIEAKEDIILNSYQGDTLTFSYTLGLGDSLAARMEPDGSLGIYGVDPVLLGNIATGSAKDAALLKKARERAPKTNLLFTFPAPFVRESGSRDDPSARAWFSLKGDTLTVHATGLRHATYPISIDPSVYINTAQQLMRGNNESNIDFDVADGLIEKGKTTGGRFDSWSTTNSLALPAARWDHATAVAGGYIYVTGGNDGTSNQSTVYWAQLNTTDGSVNAPNPGNGACASWCTSSAYNLPAPRRAQSMVAYNGFLYVIGGKDASCTTANGTGNGGVCNTVYIAKLGANGEPSLWNPTNTDKTTWTYWYQSSYSLSTERAYTALAAYNNRLYLVGGQTSASAGGVTTVEYANLNPTGDISSWTTTGMNQLPSALFGHSIQVYNDYMYVIGGDSNGTLQSAVYYVKLASNGTMNGSWTTTTPLATARMSRGGTFSVIWGGYLYVSGGCTAINASGYCTTIAGDTQLASINADGTITDWSAISATSTQMGYGFVVWRGNVYAIGGCTAQNTTTGACTTVETTVENGTILQDGEASTLDSSSPVGSGTCQSPTWTNCDMPPLGTSAGQGGQLAGGTIINNGYIYYLSGCYSVGNNSVCFSGNSGKTSPNISYAAIAADGSLSRVGTCPGTFTGSWCVDSTNTLNGKTGLAGFGYTVFNNVIYVIGGTTGTQWQTTVWRNPLNSNGTLGTWVSQSFSTVGLGPYVGYPYVFARANPSAANTDPGNLYMIGGCGGTTAVDNGLDCSGVMYTTVYKCNITTSGALDTTNTCTTSGQLQIDSEPTVAGNQGLGLMAGAVYANYVYLIGGESPDEPERGEIMYAKIDNNNNIVAADTSGIWITSPNQISPVRVRNVAFGYNGYLYALAGYNVNQGGSLNDLLYAKIDVSDGSISPFQTSTVTVSPRWDLRSIINNGYVYTLGGCSVGTPPANCTSTTATIQTFQLYNNYSGSPAAYTASTNLFATDRMGASSTIYNGYLYVAAGCTSSTDCTATTTNVQYAPLDPTTGAVGAWSNTTAALPAGRVWGKLKVAGGSLYYIGGQDSSGVPQSTIYYATPSSTGDVTAWGTATKALGDTGSGGQARTKFGAAVWNNRIYVVGGANASSAMTNTVFISPQLNAGGDITSNWQSSANTLNVARDGNMVISYANNLYSMGGYDGANYLNDSQFAQINSDGTIGGWSYTTSLPSYFRQGDGFAANGFMYVLGGRSAATTCNSHTFVAPISANTTIASGNHPTGLGDWYETNVRYTGNRYGAAVSYNQGKLYMLGGACGSTLTYTGTNRVVSTTVQSQPQIAKYSRMIDTDTDVFPTYWLLNGLDNSIGAEWQLTYRSMTNTTTSCVSPAMTTWGQDTNVGNVTLGAPGVYTPVDGSGNNTHCARFFYLSVSIDSSRAYGYPDDVTRGPTITDMSLFFTSDPSKRMRYGKTFTGGELQPYDTPF